MNHKMTVTTRTLALVASLASAVGCAPPPEEVEEVVEQAVEFDPTFQKIIDTYGVFNQYLGYAKAAYGVFQFLHNPPWMRGPSPLELMQQEIERINHKIAVLEEKLVETNRHIDAVALDAKKTSLVTVRGQLKAALDLAQMKRFDHAEGLAASAANSLSDWRFYQLPARNGGTRFDPRISTPTFTEAVTAWISIRAGGERPFDDISKGNLRGYANHLTQIADRIHAGVTCYRSCFSRWTQEPDRNCEPRILGPDESPGAQCPLRDVLVQHSNVVCQDAVTGAGETLLSVDRLADFCPDDVVHNPEGGSFHEWLPELADQKANSWYPLPVYRQLSATWHKLANQVPGLGTLDEGLGTVGNPGGGGGPGGGRPPVKR